MAISFSRPDPSSPAAVASATFATSRRGFEQTEVRELLRMVAAELARLQEREKFLERELRTAQRGVPNAAVALDEEVVTRLLGEEAARILHTAREAATQIKIRAEESAARLLRESTDEAQRVREEAEVESARRRHDASADAESELQMAKQQGRDMVNEARAYRERVLGELARRREMARQQIEQLVHGRDRLLQAFERARLAAVDVMAEMTPLGEPAEYVNLAPTTGPVPVMLSAEQLRAEAEAEADVASESESDVASDVAVGAVPEPDADLELEAVPELEAVSEIGPERDHTVVLMREVHEEHNADDPDREPAQVVALFAGEFDRAARVEARRAADAADRSEDDADKPSADDVFERLRASRVDMAVQSGHPVVDTETEIPVVSDELSVFQASPEAPAVEDELDDTPFGRRDAALTPIIVASARKLKRVLADEQNELLSTLRRNEPVRAIDALLPWEADHAERYSSAIHGELEAAALAGALSVSSGKPSVHKKSIARANALQPAVEALTTAIVSPLRERLERSVGQADGDNAELANMVRSIYREWKTQRIDEHLDDIASIAFGRGALAALAPGTPVCWMVDPHGPACPDAEDNALAGMIGAGQPFPTEHVCAPAHEGCRCMLVPAPR